MKKHRYRYLGYFTNLPGYRSKGGGFNLLRRDDGKKVKVSQKRFMKLAEEGRIAFEKEELR